MALDAGARDRLNGELRELLARMRQAGWSPGELQRLVERELSNLSAGTEQGGR